jgi:prepilin-type N-terminal cleavage/methylation domain-containing protein
MKNKLPGFTLMEVIIGMVISSLVIGLAGSAFSLIQLQFRHYKKANDQLLEESMLDDVLRSDLQRCRNAIIENAERLILDDQSSPITYQFNPGAVIRSKQAHSDTFHIKTSGLSHEEKGLLQVIHLNCLSTDAGREHYFVKQYTLEDLSRQEDKQSSE